MMKFACFERVIEILYIFVVPKPAALCTKEEQLVVTFAAGYIAGIFCAVVSHPADTVISKLNQKPGLSVSEVIRALGFAGEYRLVLAFCKCFLFLFLLGLLIIILCY